MDPMREVEISRKVEESIAGDYLDPHDPWGHAQLEIIRRMCVAFDDAMDLEEIPVETRNRVRSRVLLGDPDGIEDLYRQRLNLLARELTQKVQYTSMALPDFTDRRENSGG